MGENMSGRVSAILTAGGSGSRFGMDKQLAKIKGKPIACISAEKLIVHPIIDELVIVTKQERVNTFIRYFKENFDMDKAKYMDKIRYALDGPERYDSVFNGMIMMDDVDVVLIHDGARPFITDDMISLSVNAVLNDGYNASYVCRQVVDTIRKINDDESSETIPRHSLTSVQTPQVVIRNDWMASYNMIEKWIKQGIKITDDINMIELIMRYKHKPFKVKPIITSGSQYNIKITYPGDVDLANIWLKKKKIVV